MNKSVALALLSSLTLANTVNAEEVYEYIDTPLTVQVNDLQDDDDDGVINARDLCANTVPGAEINNDGCESYAQSQEKLQLRILFANDSDEINPIFSNQIEDMAAFLATYPTTSIELKGYASKTGEDQYNVALSERRAKAVFDKLILTGVEQSRVKIVGYGNTQLESESETEVGHALNRRVVATVVGYRGEVKSRWTIFTKLEK